MSELQEQEVVQNENNAPKKVKKVGIDKIILAVSLIGFITVSFLWLKERGTFNNIGFSTKDPVSVDLYVMSQCPYGVQAVNSIAPVVKKFGKNINFNLNYIASDNGDGTFTSLHGQAEVDGDIIQLCAKKYDSRKYLDMIVCQNNDYSNVDTNWESCAKEVGLSNIEKVRTCASSDEGKKLLSENIKLADAAYVSGSPTYYIGGEIYQSGRDEGSITKAICNINNKISLCKNTAVCYTDDDCDNDITKVGTCVNAGDVKKAKCEYSEPNKVTLTVLTDSRCEECNELEPEITDSLRSLFKGLQVKIYDYAESEEGKALFKSLPTLRLPAYLFGADVVNGEGYDNVSRYLSQAGDYLSLAVGSTFDPTKEICDNKVDDNGNGKIDCADSDCANATVCRKEISKRLDVFVMSDCPYGNMAELAVAEVVDAFGKNIDLHINYIASKNSDGTFDSLHGEYEAKEDKIELCVNHYYPAKTLSFVNCMNNKDSIKTADWTECAKENNINSSTISKCADGAEGTYLLTENIKIADGMGISASPTWIVNNKYEGYGLDAETIKELFCQYNSGLAACSQTLSTSSNVSSSASCN